jgi:rubredoxin
MDENPEMSWTCPDCQSRNATRIASNAEAGKIVDVRCPDCETQHQASVFLARSQGGAPLTVGIVWV